MKMMTNTIGDRILTYTATEQIHYGFLAENMQISVKNIMPKQRQQHAEFMGNK